MDNERLTPIFNDYMDPRDYALTDEELEEIDTVDNVINNFEKDNNENMSNAEKDEIETEIEKFKRASKKINNDLNRLKVNLSLNNNNLDISDDIRKVSNELEELDIQFKNFLTNNGQVDLSNKEIDLSKTISELKSKIKEFKTRLKELKIIQKEKYNSKVDYINEEIEKLQSLTDLNPDVVDLISKLTKLSKCDSSIRDWRAIRYLDEIDYGKIKEVNKLINEIKERLNVEKENDEEENLEIDIFGIENKIKNTDKMINDSLLSTKDNNMNDELSAIGNLINDFRIKLENNKDKLSEEEYNNYLDRINDAEANLADLNTTLRNNVNYNNTYDELLNRTNEISLDVDRLFNDIDAFFGLVLDGGREVFENRFSSLENKINELEKNIEDRYKDKKLDDNQYNNLKDKIKKIKDILEKTNDKLKDPKMIKDADIYAVLNGEIDGVEDALSRLETQIENLEKPVKDNKIRKQIDLIIKKIEDDIKRIEKMLEKYKDEKPEKYNSTMERLNLVKDKLDKSGRKYREKCPLMVKSVKSAKNFFKKYKKQVLIVAGLASFALIAHHVLIPAIMHGNIMMASTTPALRGFSKFVNSILGSAIGATRTSDGLWILSSGVIINPLSGTSSLLKGLAVSSVGSAALVTPVVIAIKKLSEKMKTVELKKKLSEEKEKINAEKSKLSKKMKEVKDKSSDKRKNEKADKMTSDYFAKLYYQFKQSGKSVDEFCEENDLSEDEKLFLNIYNSKQQQFMKEVNDTKTKKSRRSN